MAINKRTYPNDYFVWYNDDDRLAILTNDTTALSGERTTERYDTYQGSGSTGSISAFADAGGGEVLATSADHGLATGTTITTDGSTNFDTDEVVTKVTKDTFKFTASWTSTAGETGTWSTTNLVNGIRITFHSKYEEITAVTNDLKTHAGLDSSLHNALLCYIKSRLFEDTGDVQRAQYFRQMYEQKVRKHRGRRSGIRALAVGRL